MAVRPAVDSRNLVVVEITIEVKISGTCGGSGFLLLSCYGGIPMNIYQLGKSFWYCYSCCAVLSDALLC